MSVIVTGVIYAVSGFLLNHLAEKPTHLVFDNPKSNWNNLTRLVQHTEGGVLIIFLTAFMLIRRKDLTKEQKNSLLVESILIWFWCGGGVVLSNIYNSLVEK